jgi:hypothetical protein
LPINEKKFSEAPNIITSGNNDNNKELREVIKDYNLMNELVRELNVNNGLVEK